MGAEENAELVRRGYQAFVAGDLAALGEVIAEDAVWHVAGSGVLSGTKQGRDAILAYFGELAARSEGNMKVTVQDVIAGENYTVGLQHNQAESRGRTLDTDVVIVFQTRDGKVTEGREFFPDTSQADAFFA
jgi:ketosteroid isomerase-like protein